MLICSFSSIQSLFFPVRSSLLCIAPCLHPVPLPLRSAFPGCLGEAAGPWQSDGAGQRTRLASVQRGLKGKRWTDNLVVWPTAASGSCMEMITQSSSDLLTSLAPALHSYCKEPECVWANGHATIACCEGLSLQYCATTITSDHLFEAVSRVLALIALLQANGMKSYVHQGLIMKV